MDELNHGMNKKCSTNPIFKIENYFQMDPVNIWASNLGLKINIWPFLIHFMQPNVSLIKKLMMHIDFLGKNLYPVGRAELSSISVVILRYTYILLKMSNSTLSYNITKLNNVPFECLVKFWRKLVWMKQMHE